MLTELFTLPSLWNLIVSTIVFAIAAKYIHQHLNGRGMTEGRKRTLLTKCWLRPLLLLDTMRTGLSV